MYKKVRRGGRLEKQMRDSSYMNKGIVNGGLQLREKKNREKIIKNVFLASAARLQKFLSAPFESTSA